MEREIEIIPVSTPDREKTQGPVKPLTPEPQGPVKLPPKPPPPPKKA
jgi:hypothetical protein